LTIGAFSMVCMLSGVVIVVLFLALVLAKRRSSSAANQPVCGQCQYPVQGLPTFTCPECGADLREVGIITPRRHRPLGPGAKITMWSVMVFFAALVITSIAISFVPRTYIRRMSVALERPRSQAYQQIHFDGQGSYTGTSPSSWSQPLQTVTLTLKDISGKTSTLQVDLTNKRYPRFTRPDSAEPAPVELDAAALVEWLQGVGVEAPNNLRLSEAGDILNVLQKAIDNPPAGLNASSTGAFLLTRGLAGSQTMQIQQWWWIVFAVFWAIIWFFGLWRWCLTGDSRKDPLTRTSEQE